MGISLRNSVAESIRISPALLVLTLFALPAVAQNTYFERLKKQATEAIEQARKSKPTTERSFDGAYYNSQLSFGFLVEGLQGVLTVANFANYKPGEVALRFARTGPNSFSGEQVCVDGKFHKVTATLGQDGSLDMTIEGCSPTRYSMRRVNESGITLGGQGNDLAFRPLGTLAESERPEILASALAAAQGAAVSRTSDYAISHAVVFVLGQLPTDIAVQLNNSMTSAAFARLLAARMQLGEFRFVPTSSSGLLDFAIKIAVSLIDELVLERFGVDARVRQILNDHTVPAWQVATGRYPQALVGEIKVVVVNLFKIGIEARGLAADTRARVESERAAASMEQRVASQRAASANQTGIQVASCTSAGQCGPAAAQGGGGQPEEVRTSRRVLARGTDGCLTDRADARFNRRVAELGQLLMQRPQACLLEAYDTDDFAGYAALQRGIRFAAKPGDPVALIEGGEVVERALVRVGVERIVVRDAKHRRMIAYGEVTQVAAGVQRGIQLSAGAALGKVVDGASRTSFQVEIWPSGSVEYERRVVGRSAEQICSSRPHVCKELRYLATDPTDIPVLDEERAALGFLPAVPFVEVNPGLSDVSVSDRPIVLLAESLLYPTKARSSAPTVRLAKGSRLKALALHIHTTRYKLFRVVKATTHEFRDSQLRPMKVDLLVGEIIAVIAYWGEDECRFLVRGKVLAGICSGGAVPGDPSPGFLEELAPTWEEETWVEVETPNRQRGWLAQPNATGLSRHD